MDDWEYLFNYSMLVNLFLFDKYMAELKFFIFFPFCSFRCPSLEIIPQQFHESNILNLLRRLNKTRIYRLVTVSLRDGEFSVAWN